jgi:hypothetical protein
VILTNGKSTVSKSADGRKLISSLIWGDDKKTMIINTSVYLPNDDHTLDYTRTQAWLLNENLLTIDKTSIETIQESWETKGRYEKQ